MRSKAEETFVIVERFIFVVQYRFVESVQTDFSAVRIFQSTLQKKKSLNWFDRSKNTKSKLQQKHCILQTV